MKTMDKRQDTTALDFLPVSVRIGDGGLLLVGGGKEAVHKARILSRFTDKLTIVAPTVPPELRQTPFRLVEREFRESDLDGVRVLLVYTGQRERDHAIKALAEARGILTSVIDDSAHCDFVSPAIARRPADNLTIAVGSDAKDVRRAIRVRNRINELVGNGTLDLS